MSQTDDVDAPRGTEDPATEASAAATSQEKAHAERRGLRLTVRIFLISVLLLFLVRIFIFEPYAIPTGSMRSTIVEGDVILVNKLPYTIRSLRYFPFTRWRIPYIELPGLGTLERGDVVVFSLPQYADERDGDQFVKRCVAIPGDTVQMIGGRIWVNGAELPPIGEAEGAALRRRATIDQRRAYPALRYGAALTVPYKGYELRLDSATAIRWGSLIQEEGSTIEYSSRIVFVDGLPATYYTFRRDYFFALGDNSPNSLDSRYFGFVPVDNLIGQATIIYWSREPGGRIRWERMGMIIE